jgi:FkbM family methyltransferase
MLAPARAALAYCSVLQTPADLYRYGRLRVQQSRRSGRGSPATLRLRSLGGASVVCRPGQDVWTLKYTFVSQFHLPPVPLPARPTILDLGCNVGYTVAHLAHCFPDATVVGVEMDADNFHLAQANTAHCGPRVRLIHAAVWIEDGMIAYEGTAEDAYRVVAAAAAHAIRRAPARTLPTLLAEAGIDWVDYVKMDIEGAEEALLAGPLDWADRVGSLKVELHPPAELDTARKRLEARGFRCRPDDRHPHCLVAVRV